MLTKVLQVQVRHSRIRLRPRTRSTRTHLMTRRRQRTPSASPRRRSTVPQNSIEGSANLLHGSSRSGSNRRGSAGMERTTGRHVRSLLSSLTYFPRSLHPCPRSLPFDLPLHTRRDSAGLTTAHHKAVPAMARPPIDPHHKHGCLHPLRLSRRKRRREGSGNQHRVRGALSLYQRQRSLPRSYIPFIGILSFLLWYR